jgi:hypothetical protein
MIIAILALSSKPFTFTAVIAARAPRPPIASFMALHWSLWLFQIIMVGSGPRTNHIPVPFLGYTISPELLGVRAALQFVLFVVFFYFGYLKK